MHFEALGNSRCLGSLVVYRSAWKRLEFFYFASCDFVSSKRFRAHRVSLGIFLMELRLRVVLQQTRAVIEFMWKKRKNYYIMLSRNAGDIYHGPKVSSYTTTWVSLRLFLQAVKVKKLPKRG